MISAAGRVAAGIGEGNDVGAGALRLQQERGEIAGSNRMACRAKDLSAMLHELVCELLLQVMAKGIIGGDEIDALDPLLRHCARKAVAIGPGVVGPVYGVGRTFAAGEQRRTGA